MSAPALDRPILLIGLFLAGLAPRLALVIAPESTVVRVVADDAGYYLKMAAEASVGAVPSMDGLHATNGFHPLWMLVLTPVTAVVDSPTALLRIAIALGILCSVATFAVLARTLRPRLGAGATTVGLALWWLNPYSVANDASGLESALVVLCLAGSTSIGLRYVERPTLRTAISLGLLAGLVYLARTDAAVAVAALGLWAAVTVWWTKAVPAGELARHVALVIVGATAVVSPWLVWNAVNFSTISQASAWAVPRVNWDRELTPGSDSPVSIGLSSAWEFLSGTGPPTFVGVPLALMALLVGVALLVAVRGFGGAGQRRILAMSATIIVAGTLLAAVHSGIRLYPRPYYFGWVNLAWAMLLAATLSCLASSPIGAPVIERLRRFQDTLVTGVALGIVVLLGLGAMVESTNYPLYPWQSHSVAGARWLNSNSRPGEVAASFNSGLLSLYSERPVLNLDGVASNAADDAVGRRQLARYVCDEEVDWYLDFHPIFLDNYQAFLGPERSSWRLQEVQVQGPLTPDGTSGVDNPFTIFRSTCR